MTSWSRFEPPGWMIALHARLDRGLGTVGEREEGVRRQRGALQLGGLVPPCAFSIAKSHGVDAAHLARADADRAEVLCEHDRVRAHVLARPSTRTAARPTPPRWACAPSRPPCRARSWRSVSRSWSITPPITLRMSRSPGMRLAALGVLDDAHVRLARAARRAPRPNSRARTAARRSSRSRVGRARRRRRGSAPRRRRTRSAGRRRARPRRRRRSTRRRRTPHGLLCLMIAAAGTSNSRSSARPESRSSRLLKDSSLPCTFTVRASRCVRMPTCS